jgi:hypothetical protein
MRIEWTPEKLRLLEEALQKGYEMQLESEKKSAQTQSGDQGRVPFPPSGGIREFARRKYGKRRR